MKMIKKNKNKSLKIIEIIVQLKTMINKSNYKMSKNKKMKMKNQN